MKDITCEDASYEGCRQWKSYFADKFVEEIEGHGLNNAEKDQGEECIPTMR